MQQVFGTRDAHSYGGNMLPQVLQQRDWAGGYQPPDRPLFPSAGGDETRLRRVRADVGIGPYECAKHPPKPPLTPAGL